ncbi:MAG TPA: hypothetical protein VNQ76_14655, partial [Planctomicrobium sp.]|nr:hypothetical protein [Planctomicrobium sp.]
MMPTPGGSCYCGLFTISISVRLIPLHVLQQRYDDLLQSRLEIESVDWINPDVVIGGEQTRPSLVLYAIRTGSWSFFRGSEAAELRLYPGDILFAVSSPGQSLRPFDVESNSPGDASVLRIRCNPGPFSAPLANSGVPPVFHLRSPFCTMIPFDASADLLKCVAGLLLSMVLATQA